MFPFHLLNLIRAVQLFNIEKRASVGTQSKCYNSVLSLWTNGLGSACTFQKSLKKRKQEIDKLERESQEEGKLKSWKQSNTFNTTSGGSS